MRLRAWLAVWILSLLLAGACDRSLEVPVDAGPDQRQSVDLRGAGVTGDACREIAEDGACDAQLACHAVRSGDMPCDNKECNDHFVACEPGPASCTRPTSDQKCKSLLPSCRTGDALVYDGDVCPVGCAARSKCLQTDT